MKSSATWVPMVVLVLGVSIVLQVLVIPSALAFPIVPVNGRQPMAIAINNATGLAYTANNASNSVSIIGKDFFAFLNMTVGTQPISIAVNNRTNGIYVANNGSNTVTLINGSTNTLKFINVGNRPSGVAANPTTGKAYVANNGSSTVTVIPKSGTTFTWSGAPFNFNKPVAVAVNPSASQNRTLVANIGDNSVTVIPSNGLAYKFSSAVYGFGKPVAIAINPVTNYTYVANNGTNTISVIKGDGTHWTIPVGNNPVSIAVDPVFNRTVVVNQGDNSITQIKADSSMWTILGFKKPVAVAINPNTNSTYIVNRGNSTVSIIPGGSFGGFNPAIPSAPTNPLASASGTQVTLSWNNPFYNGTTPLTSFVIQKNIAPGLGAPWSTIRVCCLANKSAIITGITGTTPIAFRINATNGAGTGPASFPVFTVPGNSIAQFLQPPQAPPSSIIAAMIAKGVGFSASNFQMPPPIFTSNANFNPFQTFQLAQNLTFSSAAPIVSPTLFSDYGIQSYSPPSNWNPSTVWTIPPSIIPVSGGSGYMGAFSLSQATAGKPFFMPMTSSKPLSNGGELTGTQISVGSNSSNLQISSQFINTPPPGLAAIGNAAMYLNFTLHDATGLNYGNPSTFSSPPTIYFTLGPIAGSVINFNTVNSAIQCPNVSLSLLQSTTAISSGITVLRNPAGDTATACGYSATVQHFSSYGVVGNPTSQSGTGDVVPLPPSLAGSAYGSNEYPITIAGKGFALPSLYTPITTNIIKTGQATPIKLLIYSSSGPSAMQHVTLFMNLSGNKKNVADSDTAILYDTTSTHPLQIVDPNGFFGPVTASTTTNNGKFELDLNVTFLKPMAASDVIIRSWDTYLNSIDVQVANAIQVVGTPVNSAVVSSQNPNTSIAPTTTTPSTTTPQTQATSQAPPQTSDKVMGAIKDWGGYSTNPITDSQLLSDLGLQGSHIPQWVAKTTKWVVDGEISQQDFQAALNYMAKNSIIR